MFLRFNRRYKNGKEHRYWSIVENRRCSSGEAVQRQVLHLDGINDSQHETWCRLIETFDADAGRQLELDRFWAERSPDSREGTSWQHILQTLVCYRLNDPAASAACTGQWFEQSAMADLLGADDSLAEKNALYRCLDLLLRVQSKVMRSRCNPEDQGAPRELPKTPRRCVSPAPSTKPVSMFKSPIYHASLRIDGELNSSTAWDAEKIPHVKEPEALIRELARPPTGGASADAELAC